MKKITQTAGRNVLKEFSPEFAYYNDDVLFGENWNNQDKVIDADIVVWATPIYYYEMSGQMKVLIDRLNPMFSKDYKFRDVYFLATAAEDEEHVYEKALSGLNGWIDCFDKAELKGYVFCGGVTMGGEISGNAKLKEAYDMGAGV